MKPETLAARKREVLRAADGAGLIKVALRKEEDRLETQQFRGEREKHTALSKLKSAERAIPGLSATDVESDAAKTFGDGPFKWINKTANWLKHAGSWMAMAARIEVTALKYLWVAQASFAYFASAWTLALSTGSFGFLAGNSLVAGGLWTWSAMSRAQRTSRSTSRDLRDAEPREVNARLFSATAQTIQLGRDLTMTRKERKAVEHRTTTYEIFGDKCDAIIDTAKRGADNVSETSAGGELLTDAIAKPPVDIRDLGPTSGRNSSSQQLGDFGIGREFTI